ncbi:DUF3515 family protein [Kineococcus radiotolerans]|uniref:Secreted protein n=1 Tax=Kineococcus radiotolerans (strain ATCC BAA-149 / DSM 14245 / SRS30216) TaxID=266940 RepID=A6W7R4_KINRD|nr:DUF3515 family protein [Kineococcus radiotolerans]ABS02853.1 secreted protein [Kineococcus radiotolerans SRS30216 = ATCC BAA-149]
MSAPGPPSTPARQPPGRLVVALVVVLVAAGAVWAYLAGSRGVEAAPDAADPACTTLLAALPASLGNLGRTPQGAAGVAAWGEDRVVLRCGALVLGPTTKACVPVGPDGGPSVDWVQDAVSDRAVRFLTYGRTPAVEVTVRFGDGLTRDQATSQLVDLAGPVSAIRQTRTCV